MRVVWKEQFREKFNRLEKRLKDPRPFRKAFAKAVSTLQEGNNLADMLPVNRITAAGPGWYDCYLYKDIVMVYKIQGQRVILATVGFSKEIADDIRKLQKKF